MRFHSIAYEELAEIVKDETISLRDSDAIQTQNML